MCSYMICLIIQYLKRAIWVLKDKILIVLAIYTVGLLLALFLYLLRISKRVKIEHWECFPNYTGNLIVVSNHPSLLEPILLPVLFFKEYLSHPFKFRPISTPDKTNYYDRWYWHWLLKYAAIPIDRDNRRERFRALFQMKKLVNSGGILILFPEGGRTAKGEKFLYSKKGRKIRFLKRGVGSLVSKTNSSILYIWVDGTEKVMPIIPERLYTYPRIWKSQITIKIGKTVKFPKGTNREEIIQTIATDLLELADEEE